jgi:hypothetical protein
LTKFTGILLFGCFPILLGGFQISGRLRQGSQAAESDAWGKAWLAMGLAVGTGVFLINLGYLFQGSGSTLGGYAFSTAPFQFMQQALPGWLPIPLPYPFFKGMDAQLAEKGYVAYLLGEINQTGFWNYYLVGLLVKTPVSMLAVALLALASNCRLSRRELPMLLIAGFLVAFFSITKHKNIGIRYVLFVEPILAIWAGRLAAPPAWRKPRWHRLLAGGAGLGIVCLWVTSVASWPDYLAYFNQACGGPAKGHEYLLDSNIDWGQDLIALREFMEDQQFGVVDLAYAGWVNPQVYGIAYHHLGMGPRLRYAVISANLLWGRMYFVNGTAYWPEDPDTYQSYRSMKPRAVLGYSLYVFDRNELGEDRSR